MSISVGPSFLQPEGRAHSAPQSSAAWLPWLCDSHNALEHLHAHSDPDLSPPRRQFPCKACEYGSTDSHAFS